MYNTTIKKLIEELSTIQALETSIAEGYPDILDGIEFTEDYGVDFRQTLELEEQDFYINIKKIDEKTKNIKNYAVGLISRDKIINQLRHDDEDHHNSKKQVKEANPPHHKHEGKKERIKGSSGTLSDLIRDFKNILD